MDIAFASAAFVAAAFCAGTMGFAIQRGGTCTVAAVDELISARRATRLFALVEAALWVAGGLLLADALHLLPSMPLGYAATRWTVLGAALLGFGAWVNGACVFGAIARFGSGEWAYLVTPAGFFAGCLSVGTVFALPAADAPTAMSPLWKIALGGAIVFAAFALWRLGRPVLSARRRRRARRGDGEPFAARLRSGIATHVWSPHAATIVIGVAFVLLFVLVGAWAYTDVLAEAAHGMSAHVAARAALLLALLAGAALGGVTAGKFRHTRIDVAQLSRCFAGGVLMGWGSLLIPGGNDGLVLVGMPLLWPYAWLAFATMCATIALAISGKSALRTLRLGRFF